MNAPLTFDALRAGNIARSPHFKNARGVVNDSDKTFSLGDHVCALTGEVGEAANIIKKILRGDFELDNVYSQSEERAWLIEKHYTEVPYPYYWYGNGWTTCVDTAVRFVRECDASRAADMLPLVCDPNYFYTGTMCMWPGPTRVAEHVWLGKAITVREALAKELADNQCYLDKLARAVGVDLGEATRAKFNEVSERVGSDVRL